MSGFDASWLALREPADHAARNMEVLAAVARYFEGRDRLTIVDLGCGTGSNLRGTALHLSARDQTWHLVDADPLLLDAARGALHAWADSTAMDGDCLKLTKGRRSIVVHLVEADLAGDNLVFPALKPDLVSAAALFDLCSEAFVARVVDALAEAKAAFYTALTYDGAATWEPTDKSDAAMVAAFNAHQRQDKGLGAALGPAATDALEKHLRRLGYHSLRGKSPWVMGEDEAALVDALTEGFAKAVSETGDVPSAKISAWLASRRTAVNCTIGHDDIWAAPPMKA
jgi:SAM-dependent methyltransferase